AAKQPAGMWQRVALRPPEIKAHTIRAVDRNAKDLLEIVRIIHAAAGQQLATARSQEAACTHPARISGPTREYAQQQCIAGLAAPVDLACKLLPVVFGQRAAVLPQRFDMRAAG